MPRGKEYCHGEDDYFVRTAFENVDGTKVHCVDPPHRATDGVRVEIVNGEVVETQPPPQPPAFIVL